MEVKRELEAYLARAHAARSVLLALKGGPMTYSKLKEITGLRDSSLSRALKGLVKRGAVRQVHGMYVVDDSRVVELAEAIESRLALSSSALDNIKASLRNLHPEPLGDVSVSMALDVNFFGQHKYDLIPTIAPLAQGITASMFLTFQSWWPRKSMIDILSIFWNVRGSEVVDLMVKHRLARSEGIFLKSISDTPRIPLEKGGYAILTRLEELALRGVREAIACLIYDDCRRMLLTEEDLVREGIRVRDAKLDRRTVSSVLKVMYEGGMIKRASSGYLIPGRVLRLYGEEAERAVEELGSLDELALAIAKDLTYRPGTSAIQIVERLRRQGYDVTMDAVMERLRELRRIGFATCVPIPGFSDERAGWLTVWSPIYSEAKRLLAREDEKAMIEGLALNRAAAMAFLSMHWPELYKVDIRPIKVLDYLSKRREATLSELLEAFAADKRAAAKLGMLFNDLKNCGFVAYDPSEEVIKVREPKNFDLLLMTARKLDESPSYELEKVARAMPKLDGWLDRAAERLLRRGNGRLED